MKEARLTPWRNISKYKGEIMKEKICFSITCAILMLGCGAAKIYGSGDEPVYFNEPRAKYSLIKHFAEMENLCSEIFANKTTYDISPTIRRVLRENDGDTIIHLAWEIRESGKDEALTLFSFGQLRCWNIKVEGDIIKWR